MNEIVNKVGSNTPTKERPRLAMRSACSLKELGVHCHPSFESVVRVLPRTGSDAHGS